MNIVRFIAAFLIYTVIDVGWNLSPLARGMYESLYEASGNDALFSAYENSRTPGAVWKSLQYWPFSCS